MDNRYSIGFANRIANADQNHIGVQLAKQFIEKGIAVSEIARAMNVSRTAVYNWFTGVTEPNEETVERLEGLLETTM